MVHAGFALCCCLVPYQQRHFLECQGHVCRQQLYAGALDVSKARLALQKLSNSSTPLTSCATDLQNMDDHSQEADLDALSKQFKGEPPVQQSVVTCMTTIKKAYDEVTYNQIQAV